MPEWRRQYWDSSLFISYLAGTEAARVETIHRLLEQYERSGIEIIISSFAIAEVRRIPVEGATTPPDDEGAVETVVYDPQHLRQVRDIFTSPQLEIRVLTPRIAERAAEIGDTFPRLLPPDCVHIATAIEAEADVLFTYDGAGQRRRPGAMLRYDQRIGDGLRIMEPFVPTGPLFDPS
ncbi:MAG: type II toxin-antitoxin system VapC family toxin [Chloroflexota bacterium]|nr:type II toxin-antitoxin system VapC family toxin [Chloroflexota bacterium]